MKDRKMAFTSKDALPLWHNGPTPGAFYHFPGSQYGTGGFQKSQYVLFDNLQTFPFSLSIKFFYITYMQERTSMMIVQISQVIFSHKAEQGNKT